MVDHRRSGAFFGGIYVPRKTTPKRRSITVEISEDLQELVTDETETPAHASCTSSRSGTPPSAACREFTSQAVYSSPTAVTSAPWSLSQAMQVIPAERAIPEDRSSAVLSI